MLAAIALAASLVLPSAHALNTWGPDMSDLWWNPNESGWGINIAHQREVIFATFFVYGADNRTRWYVAPDMTHQAGGFIFAGPLYETQGPFLGGAFNPANVTASQVGTARLQFPSVNRATLTYNVGTTAVTKSIQRQTFRQADLTGLYTGAVAGTISGCSRAGDFAATGIISVSHPQSTNAVRIVTTLNNAQCTYSGTYLQEGRMGGISGGTLTCEGSSPTSGTFTGFEIEAGTNAIVLRYEALHSGCTERGRIGGIRP